jgi:hypothetical protein
MTRCWKISANRPPTGEPGCAITLVASPAPIPRLRGVIFDMDGVVIDS